MTDNNPKDAARERLYYNTRLMLASAALAGAIGTNLSVQINTGEYAVLFAPGVVFFFGLSVVVGYLLRSNHNILKRMEGKP